MSGPPERTGRNAHELSLGLDRTGGRCRRQWATEQPPTRSTATGWGGGNREKNGQIAVSFFAVLIGEIDSLDALCRRLEMQSGEYSEGTAVDASQQRELFSRQGFQTQQDTVISITLGDTP